MQKLVFLPLGVVFGFLLSRAGATTYDFYPQLFLFSHLQLLWVIAVAGAVGLVGVQLLKRLGARSLLGGEALPPKGKAYRRTLVPGAILFGAGWGVAGACPGTALAMLGEGKLGSLFTLAGLLAGTYVFGLTQGATRS
ncbi:MAG: YeeE/YedE family protein [Deltaproteobacteria bacterium]|nr:YeeE/YedE family protein [Deltaproteobacteria bacterium]